MKPKKTILIEGNLHQKLKVYCAEHGYKINKYVEGLIQHDIYTNELINHPKQDEFNEKRRQFVERTRSDETFTTEHEDFKSFIKEQEDFYKSFNKGFYNV